MATELPKITIVSPSFNQGEFVGDMLRSVREQKGAEIEHIVMDGGSTDGSAEIIERESEHLTYWQSEKDGGQTDALIQGFGRATGGKSGRARGWRLGMQSRLGAARAQWDAIRSGRKLPSYMNSHFEPMSFFGLMRTGLRP